MNAESDRLWSNVLSERSTLLRAQKALIDAQKKYSHAVDLFRAEIKDASETLAPADASTAQIAGNVATVGNNGETGI